MPTVLVFDIDGTLVPHGSAPHPAMQPALERARRAGCVMLLATARRRTSGLERLGALASVLDDGVFNNGACTWQGGALWAAETIEPTAAARAYARMAAHPATHRTSVALADEGIAFSEPLSDAERLQWGVRREDLRTVDAALGADTVRLCSWTLKGDLCELRDELEEQTAEACRWTLVDAGTCLFGTPTGVDKATAVQRWCEAHGYAAEDTIAFGDDVSDRSLLEWAGTAVAMADGHEDVRAIADTLAPPAHEGGVGTLLSQWI